MTDNGIQRIDIEQVLREKSPSLSRKIPGFLIKYLVRTIHQEELNYILETFHQYEGVEFMNKLVEYFHLDLELVNPEYMPEEGSYIFVSNHTLGGIDGICLSAVLGNRYNGRIRYLVNDLLLYINNLKTIFVPINKYGAQGRKNVSLIEEAFASENQIITFPAGLCSRRINGVITDFEWKKSFVQKAVTYQRDVVPIYFEGRNSEFFYRLTNIRKKIGIKKNIELIYLPDEMFRFKQKTFRIYFGKPIPWETFRDTRRTALEWAQWVKDICYKLK